jgi:outer membrane protein
MKKILTALTCTGLLAMTASADIARVEMGAGFMQQTSSSEASYTSSGSYTSDDDATSTQPYAWAILKHPIPVVPNFRLEYASFEDTGSAQGTFENFTVAGISDMTFNITEYDIIPYYNLLDNTGWVTIDAGLDIKIMDVSYKADAVSSGDNEDSVSIAVPLGYLRGRVEIPATNIGLEADVKYVTYNDSTIYDARAKIDYTFDIFPVVQPAFEIGYRVHKIKIDDSTFGDLKMDLDFSGVYAGAMLRF